MVYVLQVAWRMIVHSCYFRWDKESQISWNHVAIYEGDQADFGSDERWTIWMPS